MSGDSFLKMVQQKSGSKEKVASPSGHAERAHSKFSASGAERWFNCPGSVELSEGLPDKSSVWSIEGTEAHEILEAFMRCEISGNDGADVYEVENLTRGKPSEMIVHAADAASFISNLWANIPNSEITVESKVYLDFIHPEMFGTYDGAVLDFFETLHAFDFKYGAGHPVSPIKNLQMIFYGIGLAHKHHWNFKRVRLWIIQPRIKGYDGPVFWDISIEELRRYVPLFQAAVDRVLNEPDVFVEGSWCHWCKAKSKCPVKNEKRTDQAIEIFKFNKVERTADHGKKESQEKGSEKSGKEGSRQKSREEKEVDRWHEKQRRKKEKEVGDFF